MAGSGPAMTVSVRASATERVLPWGGFPRRGVRHAEPAEVRREGNKPDVAMLLLIPGPVTTRPEVRAALAQDFAPWDNDFRPIYLGVRTRLLRIAGGRPDTHVTLALQGCGHFMTEAAVRSFVPPGGKILIPTTGAYADRMIRLATEAGRQVIQLPIAQTAPHRPACRRRGTRRRSRHPPCRPGLQRDRQRRDPRRGRGRRGGARGRAAADRRRRLRLRRPALRHRRPARGRCRRLHLQQVPGGRARPRLRRRPHRPAGGLRRERRKLVVRPGRHLRAQPAHRRRQLPLHPAGAGAERAEHRARPVRRRGRPAGPPGALHRQHAGDLRRRDRPRPDALPGARGAGAGGGERPRPGRSAPGTCRPSSMR